MSGGGAKARGTRKGRTAAGSDVTPAADSPETRRAIIAACLDMNATGLNQGTSGNISVRVEGGMLVTPSGVPYRAMEPEQIVFVDADGAAHGDLAPSSEWRMHRDIYLSRAEAGAVVHTHSIYATAVSCMRRDVPAFHYMIAACGGADLRCARYETFGTAELSAAMLEALAGRRACLLANHGQIAFGPTLDKAMWLAREVETLAHQYAAARLLGEPPVLDDAEMARVLDRFATYGQQPGERRRGKG